MPPSPDPPAPHPFTREQVIRLVLCLLVEEGFRREKDSLCAAQEEPAADEPHHVTAEGE